MTEQNQHLLVLSAQIVAAHAGHNQIETDSLPKVIRSVYNTLAGLEPGLSRHSVPLPDTYRGNHRFDDDHHAHHDSHAHNIYTHPTYGETVFKDHLVCMEDGLPMKMLKRHLLTIHGMTPKQYRMKWGLPPDYPMVAADYANLRSSLALQSGLGLKDDDLTSKKRRERKAF